MTISPPKDALLSPTAAYRADIQARGQPPGKSELGWVKAALTLHCAATSAGRQRKRYLNDAIRMARSTLGRTRIKSVMGREWPGERDAVVALMVLGDDIHWAGALHLASKVLDDLLLAAEDLEPVQRGRVLSLRARVCWKLGSHDEAAERYEYIGDLGRKNGIPELIARSEIGLATIAHQRGRLKDLGIHASRAAEIAAQHELHSLGRLAQHGILIAASESKAHDRALIAGWRFWQLSEGDAAAEAEALQNIGQAMLRAGQPEIARSSFAAVMTRRAPARIMLPALGGLALASAFLNFEPTVEWAVKEIARAHRLRGMPRYELAAALLESAEALARLGRGGESDLYKEAAVAIAEADAFHELTIRAGELRSQPRKTMVSEAIPLRSEAADIAAEINGLAPKRLPKSVRYAAAPA